MTSEELYLDIKNNNSDKAFNNLRKRYFRYIQNKYTFQKSVFEAEDRFANAFTKLYSKITTNQLTNYKNISGYFLIICKHDFIQETLRNRVCFVEEIKEIDTYEVKEIEQKEIHLVASELIEMLPKHLKSICKMLFIEGKNHKEVALALNIDYQNVRKYQYKAVKIMQNYTPREYKDLIQAA